MSTLSEKLVAAARAAVNLSLLSSDEEPSHLSAQRRFDEDGVENWRVVIADEFASDMTHITDRLATDYPRSTPKCRRPDRGLLGAGLGRDPG